MRKYSYYNTHKKQKIDYAMKYQKSHYEMYKSSVSKYIRSPQGRLKVLMFKARRKNLKCTLTLDQYKALIRKPCFYCSGCLPKVGCGLDRVDNLKGYVINNVVPCCTNCNAIKSDKLTQAEMIVAMKAILKLRRSHGK